MTAMKRVVSIGAHSLDAELMGGPLILKYAKQGATCTFINITQGRLEDPNATEEEKQVYLNDLHRQNETAASILGGDALWFGCVSHDMPPLEDLAQKVEQYLVNEKVDLVITHWRGSMHRRHINTHDAVTLAVKRLREQGNPIRLVYGETFEDLVGFIPQAYFTLSQEEYDQWFAGLSAYDVFRGKINDFPYQPYYSTNVKVRQIESNNTGYTVTYMYASLIEPTLW